MDATIAERRIIRGNQVDRERGIIRNVRVCDIGQSKNGEIYSREILERALPMYQHRQICLEHDFDYPRKSRSVRDVIGILKNVRLDGKGILGDFHFNPRHPIAGQLAWDAENATEGVGLSHRVDAVVGYDQGRKLVQRIKRVVAVDLVADPANTNHLVEPEHLAASYRRSGERTRTSADDFLRQIDGRPSRGEVNDFLQQVTDGPVSTEKPATEPTNIIDQFTETY